MVVSPAMIFSTIGVCLELSAELSYPVHESIAGAISVQISAICFMIFFAIHSLLLSYFDPSYLWVLPSCSCFLGLIPICFVRPEYKRMVIEEAASGQMKMGAENPGFVMELQKVWNCRMNDFKIHRHIWYNFSLTNAKDLQGPWTHNSRQKTNWLPSHGKIKFYLGYILNIFFFEGK